MLVSGKMSYIYYFQYSFLFQALKSTFTRVQIMLLYFLSWNDEGSYTTGRLFSVICLPYSSYSITFASTFSVGMWKANRYDSIFYTNNSQLQCRSLLASHFLKIYLYFMYMRVYLHVCMYVYCMHFQYQRRPERVLGSLEVESQMYNCVVTAVSCYGGAGNRTQLPCKSSQC